MDKFFTEMICVVKQHHVDQYNETVYKLQWQRKVVNFGEGGGGGGGEMSELK